MLNRSLAALATTAALLVAMPGASAARVDPADALQLPGWLVDSAVDADGSLRLATADRQSIGGRAIADLVRFDASGEARRPLALLPPTDLTTTADAALTPTGAVVAYRTLRKPHPRVRVFDRTEGGSATRAVTVSDKAHGARLREVVAGGGAAAVTFDQHLGGGRWRAMLAFRPAGAPRFLPAVPLGRTDVQAEVLLSATGTGVVRDTEGGRDTVRRLRVDGTLGAPISLPAVPGSGFDGRSVIQDDGTLVVVTATTTDIGLSKDPRYDGDVYDNDLYVTTLPPGDDVPTPLQHLAHAFNPHNEGGEHSVATGPGGELAIASTVTPGQTTVFTGPPTALTQTGVVKGAYGMKVAVTPEGGTVGVWSRSEGDADGHDDRLLETHRPPGGAFSAPADIVPPNHVTRSVDHLIALPGGEAALVYGEFDQEDEQHAYVLRFRM